MLRLATAFPRSEQRGSTFPMKLLRRLTDEEIRAMSPAQRLDLFRREMESAAIWVIVSSALSAAAALFALFNS